MSGLQESFAGRIEFVVLDYDDPAHDARRSQLGITAQAQYLIVDGDGAIASRWFGLLDELQVAAELERLLQT